VHFDDDDLGVDAIKACRRAGISSASPHTLARYEKAFYRPTAVGLVELRELDRRRFAQRHAARHRHLEESCWPTRSAAARPGVREAIERLRRARAPLEIGRA
jgi:trimethylamine:corrinoid methyltransferase-like protein